LEDVAEFFNLWDDVLFDGFRKRAGEVQKLLSSTESLFFAVTSPMARPLKEAVYLYEKLAEHHIAFGGFIINRVNPCYAPSHSDDSDFSALLNEPGIDKLLAEKLRLNFEKYKDLGRSDVSAIEEIKSKAGRNILIRQVPLFDSDIYDIKGLLKIREHLVKCQ
jgi:anion-transporting  ArsA/GET3 family ATPase